MQINIDEAMATVNDNESIKAVLTELYENIKELKDERDRLKVKALARKVEVKRLKKFIFERII